MSLCFCIRINSASGAEQWVPPGGAAGISLQVFRHGWSMDESGQSRWVNGTLGTLPGGLLNPTSMIRPYHPHMAIGSFHTPSALATPDSSFSPKHPMYPHISTSLFKIFPFAWTLPLCLFHQNPVSTVEVTPSLLYPHGPFYWRSCFMMPFIMVQTANYPWGSLSWWPTTMLSQQPWAAESSVSCYSWGSQDVEKVSVLF